MSNIKAFTAKFPPASITRAIPEPSPDLESLFKTVSAMKELLETLTRQRGDSLQSAVTVDDLHRLGFADLL